MLTYQAGSIPGYGAPLKTVATYAGLTGAAYFRAVLADVSERHGVDGDDITGLSRLRQIVPTGVCDFDRPGLGQVPVQPWAVW